VTAGAGRVWPAGFAGLTPGPVRWRPQLALGPAPDRSARLTRIMNSAMIGISPRMAAETR